jgi:AraC-like DNA-binding protein
MKYSYHKPHLLLQKYVQSILVLEESKDDSPSDLPLFTNGMPALLCEIKEGTNEFTLFGESIPSEKWEINPNTLLIAFFFKPFSLTTIFRLSAKALKEKPVVLNLWNSQKTIALNLQLCYCKSTDEKIEILNHFVLSEFQSNQRDCELIKFATDLILENPNGDVFVNILQELNLTERTFQRIFKKYMGITANQYRRICQFHFSFFQLKGNYFNHLSDIAYANGYFDQSHYIRSFKEFTKTTPKDYLEFGLQKK